MSQIDSQAIDAGSVALLGALTVREAKQIQAWLLDALRQHPAVTIDCTHATDVDLSFIQLVLAARLSASAAGKTLALAEPASGAVLDTLIRAGLVSPAGDQPTADQAFWLNGEASGGKDHSYSG